MPKPIPPLTLGISVFIENKHRCSLPGQVIASLDLCIIPIPVENIQDISQED